ncbi:hypothetical protein QQS21_007557 [Conoideocrella luteorostrata]|uniref:Uncharacterized protein n=1 Tax=Conoideocrella luteorostrata TaxID=1105319 RepID=A0AAJ0CLA3_9HYPO|nr:hypothetical protein QQS21_007557 [Conoideocrella luteorostrata]
MKSILKKSSQYSAATEDPYSSRSPVTNDQFLAPSQQAVVRFKEGPPEVQDAATPEKAVQVATQPISFTSLAVPKYITKRPYVGRAAHERSCFRAKGSTDTISMEELRSLKVKSHTLTDQELARREHDRREYEKLGLLNDEDHTIQTLNSSYLSASQARTRSGKLTVKRTTPLTGTSSLLNQALRFGERTGRATHTTIQCRQEAYGSLGRSASAANECLKAHLSGSVDDHGPGSDSSPQSWITDYADRVGRWMRS